MANEFKIKNGVTIDSSAPASGIVTDLSTALITDLVTGSGIKSYVDEQVTGGGIPSVGDYGDIDASDGDGGWYNTDIHVNESGVGFPGQEVRLSTNDADGVLKLFNAIDETSDSIIELSPSGIYINNTINGVDPVVGGDLVTKKFAEENYSNASQGHGLSMYLGNSGVTGDNFNLTPSPDVGSGVIVDTDGDVVEVRDFKNISVFMGNIFIAFTTLSIISHVDILPEISIPTATYLVSAFTLIAPGVINLLDNLLLLIYGAYFIVLLHQ